MTVIRIFILLQKTFILVFKSSTSASSGYETHSGVLKQPNYFCWK
ncbi:ubiquitin-conjugating enzyme E2D 1, transcript variant X5, partial [Columba livia]